MVRAHLLFNECRLCSAALFTNVLSCSHSPRYHHPHSSSSSQRSARPCRGSTSSPVSRSNTLPWYLNSLQYTLILYFGSVHVRVLGVSALVLVLHLVPVSVTVSVTPVSILVSMTVSNISKSPTGNAAMHAILALSSTGSRSQCDKYGCDSLCDNDILVEPRAHFAQEQ